MTSLDNDKRALRRGARQRRLALGDRRLEASDRINERLLAIPEVQAAETIALYAGLPGEVDPSVTLDELLRRGTTVLLPRVSGDGLALVEITSLADLSPGFGGVPESLGAASELSELDVVVVPGLAFTPTGDRLGQGGGHYDRLLSCLPRRTLRIALGFAVQVLESLPTGPLDEPVDVLVTEDAVVRTGARGQTVRSDT